ncbi:MAG: hypothetical protein PWQ37_706 [Candidatus Petromonas sp.]|jgi:hypothetical protein|nr:hypothetical protein [Candidatus Petromonas sp.]
MGLTVQQLFEYIDTLTKDKPGLIIKGFKNEQSIFYKIYLLHDKYFLDTLYDIDSPNDIVQRDILDKEELQLFKVKVMEKLKGVQVENIYID